MYLIIPARNEAKRIGKTLQEYLDHFPAIKILVVLSNCNDNSEKVIQSFQLKFPDSLEYITAQLIPGNSKGLAVRQGFEYVLRNKRTDCIGFIDADNSVAPFEFAKLLDSIKENEAVISSRYLPTSRLLDRDSVLRKTASWLFRKLVAILFRLPLVDSQCGGKIYKTVAIKKIIDKLAVNDMTFDIEILYLLKRHGLKIKEVPIVWRENIASTISTSGPTFIRTSVEMFWSLLKLRWRFWFFRK